MFSSRTLIKHYTPPTCTLEIHSNSSFFLGNNNSKIPERFRFNLHFDDPRLPDEKRITLKGDRSRLESLCQIVNDYINKLMQDNESKTYEQSDINNNKEVNTDIYFVNQGLLNQELYYFSRDKNNIETTVKLTTLQLFDLANALEQYTLDINNPEEDNFDAHKKSTLISLSAMVLISIIFGGVWWYDRQIIARNEQENTNLESDTEIPSVLDELDAPQALNPENIPSVPELQVPSDLQNRKTLPPPSPILAQPPNQENNQLPPPPKPKETNNQNAENIVIPPPPQRPLPPPPSNSESMPTSNNVIAITPKSSTSNADSNQSDNNPRFSSLPVLQSRSGITPPSNIEAGLNNNVSVLPQNINRIPSSFNSPNSSLSQPQVAKNNSSGQTKTATEVKQYFQKKWQPPENLSQSIEYRLVVNNDGSLQRVTPMGQAATTFLDRTGMPLMGEVIASSLPENPSSTIRLILSPNGNVETFIE